MCVCNPIAVSVSWLVPVCPRARRYRPTTGGGDGDSEGLLLSSRSQAS
jgi:hypothetical protein